MMRTWARVGVAAVLVAMGPPAWAQTRLAAAKTLYLNAAYEDALKLLAEVAVTEPTAPVDETHHYRALCLLALGRATDAELAMSAAVEANPFFVPSASDVSPRVSRMYVDVRQRLLPQIVRRRLAEARERYRDGERQLALDGFEAVLKLLGDPSLASRDDLSDLRLAANGFADLARAQPEPTPPTVVSGAPIPPIASPLPAPGRPATAVRAAAPTPPVTPVAVASAPRSVSTPAASTTVPSGESVDRSAVAPVLTSAVAISQVLPRWVPPDANTARRAFAGSVHVSIDARGFVTAARMERSVFPTYDRLVLEATRGWRYRPATQNGEPVRADVIVQIQLRPQTN
jgi:tetratricopeptide (TPR) repeat protein